MLVLAAGTTASARPTFAAGDLDNHGQVAAGAAAGQVPSTLVDLGTGRAE
jgi:hypothetical protein